MLGRLFVNCGNDCSDTDWHRAHYCRLATEHWRRGATVETRIVSVCRTVPMATTVGLHGAAECQAH
jgi:hypothetical protein